jgi:hypothetical protein
MDTGNLKNRLGGKVQALESEPKKEGIIAMQSTSLAATVNSGYIALANNVLDIIGENLKNQPLSYQLFDIVKSPSGGATVFSVPGLSGEEAEKELTGIILDYTTPRAYWDTPEPIEGEPPACFSRNSLVSHDGKPCSRCPYNDFGSNPKEDSNAKACKESVMLFLLRPDNILPLIVRIPVSSKLIFQRYMTRLIGRMIPLSGVVTRITLEKATSKTGKPYALYNFEAASTLSSEEYANVRAFGQKFMEILSVDDMEQNIGRVA